MPVKYESRKFIDLILRATSKWANWDPPRQIKIGDYGVVNKDTGEFECEGNIFSESFQATAASIGVNLRDLGPVLNGEETEIIVTSNGVTATRLNVTPQVGVTNIAHASLRVQLQCNDTRGAALIVYKPQYWTLPQDQGLYKLLKQRPDPLNDKYIVTEIIKCPGYVLYLSNKTTESFDVYLGADVPALPNVNVGGRAEISLAGQKATGFLRRANGNEATYVPLFKLQQPPAWFWKWTQPRRGEPPRQENFNSFEDVLPPWKLLDEDGEEQDYYDPKDTWSDDSEGDEA